MYLVVYPALILTCTVCILAVSLHLGENKNKAIDQAKFLFLIASLCPGGVLNLTCVTSDNSLLWSVITSSYTESRFVTTYDTVKQQTKLKFSSFTFSRIQTNNSSVLTSTLLLENVTTYFNGTMINCTSVSSMQTLMSHTIRIVTTGMLVL